jgi:cytochrome c
MIQNYFFLKFKKRATNKGLRLLAAFLCYSSATCSLAADATAGADSFDANCAECHSIAKPIKNKKGPSLVGVVGRNSASVPGFDYSDAMKKASLLWTKENLDAYIKNPKAVVPNDKMKFKGLNDANERIDLIEFLSKQN